MTAIPLPWRANVGFRLKQDNDDGDGYTNLEEWLHGYAARVERAGKQFVRGYPDRKEQE